MLYAHLSYPYMLPVLPNLIVNHFFRPPVSYSFIDPNIYTFTLPIIIACYLCHNFHGRTNSEKEMHAPSCSKHGCKLGDFFHHGMQVVHQQSSKTFHNFLSFLDTFGSAVLQIVTKSTNLTVYLHHIQIQGLITILVPFSCKSSYKMEGQTSHVAAERLATGQKTQSAKEWQVIQLSMPRLENIKYELHSSDFRLSDHTIQLRSILNIGRATDAQTHRHYWRNGQNGG